MPLFLRSYRLMTFGMVGLGVIVTLLMGAGRGEALNSAAPVVPSVSDAQMSSVLASTRNASLAAGKLLGAGTTGNPLTTQNFEDIAIIDASVLETPLDAAEQAQGRDTIATQYRSHPQDFVKGLEIEHKLARVFLDGSATEQMQARTIVWLGWVAAAQGNLLTARWVATVKRHDVPVVTQSGLTVTNRQLDAMFVSNDWVAKAANLPLSTPETRAAFTRELPARFSAMTQAERQQLALADLRWDALRGVLGFGLQDKAVEIVHQNVHGSNDVPMGARHLENASLEFEQGMAQFNKQMWGRTLAIMGGVGQGAVAESMNMAQDRFEGKFDATPHH
ncbi:MAG: hypothetical protein ABSD67_15180 [Terracidiphilus sp.]|jgi:hypothetical protein